MTLTRGMVIQSLQNLLGGQEKEDRGAMGDGWSKTGKLRRGLAQSRIYTMQAEFNIDRGGSGAQYYTLQFGVSDLPADGVFDAIAEVLWSTEGADVRRLISVANGVTISGTAQAVTVNVYDRTHSGLYLGSAGTEYRVDTLLTPGVRPSRQMPPILIPETSVGGTVMGRFTLAPGADLDIPIPQLAGVISLWLAVIADTGSAPPVIGDSVATYLAGSTDIGAFDPMIASGFIPIAPACKTLNVANLTVAKTLQYHLIFGIEG